MVCVGVCACDRTPLTARPAFIKQYGKTEIKNIMKNTYGAFLRNEILKAQYRINVDE